MYNLGYDFALLCDDYKKVRKLYKEGFLDVIRNEEKTVYKLKIL